MTLRGTSYELVVTTATTYDAHPVGSSLLASQHLLHPGGDGLGRGSLPNLGEVADRRRAPGSARACRCHRRSLVHEPGSRVDDPGGPDRDEQVAAEQARWISSMPYGISPNQTTSGRSAGFAAGGARRLVAALVAHQGRRRSPVHRAARSRPCMWSTRLRPARSCRSSMFWVTRKQVVTEDLLQLGQRTVRGVRLHPDQSGPAGVVEPLHHRRVGARASSRRRGSVPRAGGPPTARRSRGRSAHAALGGDPGTGEHDDLHGILMRSRLSTPGPRVVVSSPGALRAGALHGSWSPACCCVRRATANTVEPLNGSVMDAWCPDSEIAASAGLDRNTPKIAL